MNHVAELSDASQTLHNKIVSILVANNKPADPDNIIKSACETILKLYALDNVEKVESILNIVVAYREHIVYGDLLFNVVECAIDQHTDLALSIVKSCLRNAGNADTSRIQSLLLDRRGLAGVAHVITKHFNISKADLGEIGQTAGDRSACYAGQFVSKLGLMRANGDQTGEFVLSYMKSASDLGPDVLVRIIDALSPENKDNFEILGLVYGFNRRNTNLQKLSRLSGHALEGCESIISPKLIELTRYEMIEAKHSDHRLEEFVSLFSDLLLPNFIPLIEEINGVFLSENKFVGLLRNIIRYIKVEVFIEIVKPIQVEKHCNVFKGVSNCDLEVFTGLYALYNTEERNAQMGYLLACLPHFCNYCTDYGNNIGEVISVIRGSIPAHRNLACSALEKMLYSHTLNMKGGLVLDNPIEKAESARILESLKASGIVQDVVQALMCSNNNECDRALELLIDLTGLDLSGELMSAILKPQEGGRVGLYDALRLMAFFAHKWKYEYDLISELLRLTTSAENNIQKRAYFLLYRICCAQAVPCFCDLLFTSTAAGMHPSSTRNRIMLLYAIAKRGCAGCKCEDMREKFFSELAKYAKNGNVKAKKFAREIAVELADNPDLRTFILGRIDRETGDQELVGGCLEVAFIILEHIGRNEEYRLRNEERCGGGPAGNCEFTGALFAKINHISFSSEQLVKSILKLFALMFSLPACSALAGDITFILSRYIPRFNKKLNRELRECTLAAQNGGHKLSREMVLLLKFKNRSGRPKEIQVLKNRTD